MDHTSLSSIVSAARYFKTQETTLHGLINNAGIMATPFSLTADGYEEQWQTNYLAHWLLTTHLLPILLSTSRSLPPGSVRIVNVSSFGHFNAPSCGINFSDPSLPHSSPMTRYGQSKLANILHIKTLNHLYGPSTTPPPKPEGEIWTAAVHPGLVSSNLGQRAELTMLMKIIIAPYRWFGGIMDADRGSWTNVFCAASPDMKREQSGGYFQRIADPPGWQSGLAKDLELAEKLEEWTRGELKRFLVGV